ncbi:MAG: hypothetical protein EXS48_00940 [Candidatus Staskawiczbacteria bacterium]|nr:hypothetical protein [Candidatus Staskawiczbacteria bacterium]
MEFSWPIFVMTWIVNAICMGAMCLAQQMDKSLPLRHSIIPGTNQKFLYMRDWCAFWSDFLAVPLIINAFVHLVIKDQKNLWWGLPIMVISALVFLKMCLGENHKPDQGFPSAGVVGLNGWAHLPYFGFCIAAAAICIWNLITSDLRGPVMWVGLIGGAFYIGCFIGDIKTGNFDSLKSI